MTAKSNTWETQLLQFVFNATAVPWDSGLTNLFISAHTSSPGEAGAQNTNEANYTGYTRVTMSRSSSAFTVASGSMSLASPITFGACSAGTNTITHVGIGSSFSSTGSLIYYGTVSSPSGGLVVNSGITPSFAAAALTLAED